MATRPLSLVFDETVIRMRRTSVTSRSIALVSPKLTITEKIGAAPSRLISTMCDDVDFWSSGMPSVPRKRFRARLALISTLSGVGSAYIWSALTYPTPSIDRGRMSAELVLSTIRAFVTMASAGVAGIVVETGVRVPDVSGVDVVGDTEVPCVVTGSALVGAAVVVVACAATLTSLSSPPPQPTMTTADASAQARNRRFLPSPLESIAGV